MNKQLVSILRQMDNKTKMMAQYTDDPVEYVKDIIFDCFTSQDTKEIIFEGEDKETFLAFLDYFESAIIFYRLAVIYPEDFVLRSYQYNRKNSNVGYNITFNITESFNVLFIIALTHKDKIIFQAISSESESLSYYY